MAQPPPRKGAYSKQTQNVNKEQYSKLQLKIQQEGDLLEDVRTFVKQKASIEKHYADAMLKLSTTYSHKRIASLLDINEDTSSGNKPNEKNVYTIWKHLLDENEKIAKARLAAVQVLQEEVEKDAKVLRNTKQSQAKKALERLAIVQKEIQQTVAEVDRTKRAYFEDESSAHDVRDKAKDAEDRSKGKKKDVMSLFHSKSTLRKHAGKLSAKQEECDIRSTGARNDYILSIASANAHQDFYFKNDLQESIRNSELNFYEKISTYLNTVARAEVLTTTAVLSSFSNIRDQAECITRDYNYNCYMQAYPCFREHINYEYEACEGDSTTIITPSEHDGGYSLNYEARQNASKLNQASKTIKAYNKRIKACHYHKTKGLKQEPNDTGGPDLNTKIIELQIAIRNAEMEKARAEARLSKLREGGIAVDEYIDASVYAPTPVESEPAKQPQPKQEVSEPQQMMGQTMDNKDSWATSAPSNEVDRQEEISAYEDRATAAQGEAVSSYETFQGANDAWASWDQSQEQQPPPPPPPPPQQQQYDYNQGWAEFDSKQEEEQNAAALEQTQEAVVQKSEELQSTENMGRAVVLYDFEGQAADELTVREGESIFILYNECDEEGWVMAQNPSGSKGYVPQNYLEFEALPAENGERQEESRVEVEAQRAYEQESSNYTSILTEVPPTSAYQSAPISSTAISTHVEEEPSIPTAPQQLQQESDAEESSSEEASESSSDGPPLDLPPPPPPPALLPQSSPKQKPKRPSSMALSSSSGPVEYCKALYDYEATGSDEITFIEGQVIRILNKDPNGINDGWWLGELYEGDGKSGLFPSIVVEECLENGESAEESSDSSTGSPDSSIAPPCFTPPGMESKKKLIENQPSIEIVAEDVNSIKIDSPEDKDDKENVATSTSAPLMPPIMVTNPTPIDPCPLKSSKVEPEEKETEPPVSFSVEAPNFEINISEEAHDVYSKAEVAEEKPQNIPSIAIVEPPVPPPLPSSSLNSMEIIVTAPTPRVQSPTHTNDNEKKRNIIEELKQHPVFKEKKKETVEMEEQPIVETAKPKPSIEIESPPKKESLEDQIQEIQRQIEPAVQEIEAKALSAAKKASIKPIPTITTDPPHSSDDDDDANEEDEVEEEDSETKSRSHKDASSPDSSESESGPDDVSSSDEESEHQSINPLPPDELEIRQLKKLDKLKESTA